jgi:hypothetical protein
MLHTYRTAVRKSPRAEQTPSFQVVLESLNDQDHADGHAECADASAEAGGDDSNAICSSGTGASHSVAQANIHSQVTSQGTGAVKSRNMYVCDVLIVHTYTGVLHSHKKSDILACVLRTT